MIEKWYNKKMSSWYENRKISDDKHVQCALCTNYK